LRLSQMSIIMDSGKMVNVMEEAVNTGAMVLYTRAIGNRT
jgi:hypothetical protein